MNEIALALYHRVFLRSIDCCIATQPFVHQDRVLDYHVMIYVQKGCITVHEDDVHYRVGENSLAFLKAGIRHWGTEEIQKGTSWYYIHFYLNQPGPSIEELSRYAGFVRNQEFSPEDYRYKVTLPKQLQLSHQNAVLPAAAEILSVYRSGGLDRAERASGLLQRLLLSLPAQNPDNPATRQDVIVDKLVDYLEHCLDRAVTSSEISAHMNMNYQYLCELFKKKTGMSIHRYHARLRMTESARLLREETINISQAAERVGYQDPLYFSAVFRQVMGMCPSEYLKQGGRK